MSTRAKPVANMSRAADTKTPNLIQATNAQIVKQDLLLKSRVAKAIENTNDKVDTPFEVDTFLPGKIGSIDTPVEVDRFVKENNGLINDKVQQKSDGNEPEADRSIQMKK